MLWLTKIYTSSIKTWYFLENNLCEWVLILSFIIFGKNFICTNSLTVSASVLIISSSAFSLSWSGSLFDLPAFFPAWLLDSQLLTSLCCWVLPEVSLANSRFSIRYLMVEIELRKLSNNYTCLPQSQWNISWSFNHFSRDHLLILDNFPPWMSLFCS